MSWTIYYISNGIWSKSTHKSPSIFQFIKWKRTTATVFRYFYIRLCSLRERAFIVLLTWYNCLDLWMFKESIQLNMITSAPTERATEQAIGRWTKSWRCAWWPLQCHCSPLVNFTPEQSKKEPMSERALAIIEHCIIRNLQ